MDQQMLLDIARMVSWQSTLVVIMSGTLLAGLIIMGWELYGVHKALQGVAASVEGVAASVERMAQMTAEVLRRTPTP
jgi:hypothetical protein